MNSTLKSIADKGSFPRYLTIAKLHKNSIHELTESFFSNQTAVLVDENTKKHCLKKFDVKGISIFEIKSGESSKNIETCVELWQKMTKLPFTRQSLLINLGGGVIGDLGGFVAATFKRGIRFVNIPTTLLAQVDAGIGGKLGFNLLGYKNQIGLFKEPDRVLVDTSFFDTLNERELKSGFAESIKHALIGSENLWSYLLKTSFENLEWNYLVPESIQIKNDIVTKDLLEKGVRKKLNFGHTMGHAIESHFLNTKDELLHGEAVALGILLEVHIANQLGYLKTRFDEIKQYVLKYYPPTNKIPSVDILNNYLMQDKKNSKKNKISFSVLEDIGECKEDVYVEKNIIDNSIDYYNSLI